LETSNNTGIIVLIPPIKQTEALARHLAAAAAAAALPGTAPTPRETKARPAAAIRGIDQSSRLSFAHALCGGKKQLLYVATRCCEVDPFACFSFLFLPSVFVEMKLPSMFHL